MCLHLCASSHHASLLLRQSVAMPNYTNNLTLDSRVRAEMRAPVTPIVANHYPDIQMRVREHDGRYEVGE